jgi:pyridoxal phosphate enzyme (YggS family)
MMLEENLKVVRTRIAAACVRSNRKPDEVLLLAVSKTFSPNLVRAVADAGQLDFGENYVQELQEKKKALEGLGIRWHFIGHLQSNKVRQIAEYIHLIHSVDNEHLALEIHRRAENSNRTVDVLIEVHTTDEATKFGVLPENTVDLVKKISKLDRLKVRGLMTMGPFSDDPEDSRTSFQATAHLMKRLEAEAIENVTMQHLSMGMSHDFETAIEEGATIVRIGTAIFGRRTKDFNKQTKGAS